MGVSTGCRRGRIWNDSSSSTGARQERVGGGSDAGGAGRALPHGAPVPGPVGRVSLAERCVRRRRGAGGGEDAARARGAEDEAQATATRRDLRPPGTGDVAPRGAHQPGPTGGGGGPATPTCCACSNSWLKALRVRDVFATRRTAGATRAPSYSTGRGGRRCARRSSTGSD